MTPRQRLLAIKLSEKINKNPSYAEKIGVVIKNKNNKAIGVKWNGKDFT